MSVSKLLNKIQIKIHIKNFLVKGGDPFKISPWQVNKSGHKNNSCICYKGNLNVDVSKSRY